MTISILLARLSRIRRRSRPPVVVIIKNAGVSIEWGRG